MINVFYQALAAGATRTITYQTVAGNPLPPGDRFICNRVRWWLDDGLEQPGDNPGTTLPDDHTCLATAGDVSQQLPREVFGIDFEPLPVANLDQIRRSFLRVTNGDFAQENFHVQPK